MCILCVDTSEVPEFHHNVIFKENILSLRKEAQIDPTDAAAHERAVREAKIKRNGALMTLDQLVHIYGPKLFDQVTKLKEMMIEPLRYLSKTEEVSQDELKGQSVMMLLVYFVPYFRKWISELYPEVIDNLDLFFPGLQSEYSVFRYSTAKCLATICSGVPAKAFIFIVNSVLPMLKNAGM